MSFYQETRPESEIESSFISGTLKKIDGYCDHYEIVFEAKVMLL